MNLKNYNNLTEAEKRAVAFKDRPIQFKALTFVALALVLVVALSFFTGGEEKSPESVALEATLDRFPNLPHAENMTLVEASIKRHLDDVLSFPESYEYIESFNPTTPGDGRFYVRHAYRAKNGFGVTQRQEGVFVLDSAGRVIEMKLK